VSIHLNQLLELIEPWDPWIKIASAVGAFGVVVGLVKYSGRFFRWAFTSLPDGESKDSLRRKAVDRTRRRIHDQLKNVEWRWEEGALNDDGSQRRPCVDCGASISLSAKRCAECHMKFRAKDAERQRKAAEALDKEYKALDEDDREGRKKLDRSVFDWIIKRSRERQGIVSPEPKPKDEGPSYCGIPIRKISELDTGKVYGEPEPTAKQGILDHFDKMVEDIKFEPPKLSGPVYFYADKEVYALEPDGKMRRTTAKVRSCIDCGASTPDRYCRPCAEKRAATRHMTCEQCSKNLTYLDTQSGVRCPRCGWNHEPPSKDYPIVRTMRCPGCGADIRYSSVVEGVRCYRCHWRASWK